MYLLSPLAGLTAKYSDKVRNQTDRVLVLMEFIIWQQTAILEEITSRMSMRNPTEGLPAHASCPLAPRSQISQNKVT